MAPDENLRLDALADAEARRITAKNIAADQSHNERLAGEAAVEDTAHLQRDALRQSLEQKRFTFPEAHITTAGTIEIGGQPLATKVSAEVLGALQQYAKAAGSNALSITLDVGRGVVLLGPTIFTLGRENLAQLLYAIQNADPIVGIGAAALLAILGRATVMVQAKARGGAGAGEAEMMPMEPVPPRKEVAKQKKLPPEIAIIKTKHPSLAKGATHWSELAWRQIEENPALLTQQRNLAKQLKDQLSNQARVINVPNSIGDAKGYNILRAHVTSIANNPYGQLLAILQAAGLHSEAVRVRSSMDVPIKIIFEKDYTGSFSCTVKHVPDGRSDGTKGSVTTRIEVTFRFNVTKAPTKEQFEEELLRALVSATQRNVDHPSPVPPMPAGAGAPPMPERQHWSGDATSTKIANPALQLGDEELIAHTAMGLLRDPRKPSEPMEIRHKAGTLMSVYLHPFENTIRPWMRGLMTTDECGDRLVPQLQSHLKLDEPTARTLAQAIFNGNMDAALEIWTKALQHIPSNQEAITFDPRGDVPPNIMRLAKLPRGKADPKPKRP